MWAWQCTACGYDMDGLGADPHKCPECGAMTESFHAIPRYAPTTRSLRAMCWLVLLMATGQVVNLAFYFLFWFHDSGASDNRVMLWTAIAGSFVTLSLLPGAVLIARVDVTHHETKRWIASRQRRGAFAVLRLDLEAYVPAMLRRSDALVAIMVLGLAMELGSMLYITVEIEPQIIPDKWIEWFLASILMIEGFVVATGAAALLVQLVLERLPRRRHRVLLGIGRPVFVHGLWVAAAFAIVSCGCYLLTLYVSWFCMIAITLLSIVTASSHIWRFDEPLSTSRSA